MKRVLIIILAVAWLAVFALFATTTRVHGALLAEITVGIEDEELSDPFDPIEFTLELDHPTLGVELWSIDVDEFDIGETFDIPLEPFAGMLTHPEVGFASTFGFDQIGWADYLTLILDDDTPFPIFGERFDPLGGPGLMGYTVTGIEATILEACRWCAYDFSLDAAWVISIYGTGVPGDYNGNGETDAADYVVWRELFGRGITNIPDYNFWRKNFGRTLAAASGIPEPATWLLILIGLIVLCPIRHRQTSKV